jgi:hypothetical protein
MLPLPILAAGAAARALRHPRPRPLSRADPKDRAALEKQLDSARVRLDDAARDVADLTRQ